MTTQNPVDQQAMKDPTVEKQDSEPPAIAPVEAPAVWGPAEMQAAIFDAVRDELDDEELTDEEIAEGFRYADKFVVQGPDGKALLEFEVGRPYPGLEASWIVGMFTLPIEDSVLGDLRIYVAVPTLPVAGVADHLCYVFNRATMTTRREKMTRSLFVEEVASENARLFDDADDDDEEEEEDEGDDGPVCADEECENPVAFACTCQVCAELEANDRFYVCADHRGSLQVERQHVEQMKRPGRWQKLPAPAAPPSGTA